MQLFKVCEGCSCVCIATYSLKQLHMSGGKSLRYIYILTVAVTWPLCVCVCVCANAFGRRPNWYDWQLSSALFLLVACFRDFQVSLRVSEKMLILRAFAKHRRNGEGGTTGCCMAQCAEVVQVLMRGSCCRRHEPDSHLSVQAGTASKHSSITACDLIFIFELYKKNGKCFVGIS